ncbi:hypothetical protein AAFF_G00004860 [Aldrovandia affinis]|uniref:Uncharacterized protein n=1 Tax=Aldrovandia affinis TaxID=143900 RepID=A0AAD7TEA3_9TELE|nr:hypothetical protein AAFF_G00004860 [Aldrovandia affinis]
MLTCGRKLHIQLDSSGLYDAVGVPEGCGAGGGTRANKGAESSSETRPSERFLLLPPQHMWSAPNGMQLDTS